MKRTNKKAFTLIELIAVLVILAILALIVTPLVMNIVKKAKESANKRSVDAYGKSVELAVATYLLDNGDYPESLDNLPVEYSGNEVTCLTKTLNSDGSIYLSGCSVKNTEVFDDSNADGYYHYGRLTGGTVTPEPEPEPEPIVETYSVGDEVTYNNVDYYVIKDSTASDESVTLLKKTPLTYEEVTTYSDGTGASTNDNSGIGRMQYHASSSEYATSYVKTVVDAWKEDKAPLASEARLINTTELGNLGYGEIDGDSYYPVTSSVPSWVYNSAYWYWTMTPSFSSDVWSVDKSGGLNYYSSVLSLDAVRPVITISKSNL